MRQLLPVLLLIPLLGCESATASPVDVAAGAYELVEASGISPFFDTPITVSEGSLVLADGEYSMEYVIQAHPDLPPRRRQEAGSYSFDDLGNGSHKVSFDRQGEVARLNGDILEFHRREADWILVWRRTTPRP